MPYGEPFPPPPYGGGMPMSPYASGLPMPPMSPMSPYGAPMPPMMPGGPGFGPPGAMMMPPPGLGDPMGFLLPSLFKAIGGIFGGGRRPPPPPPPPVAVSVQPGLPFRSGMPPIPELFYRDRPQFCRVFCPPMPGMPAQGTTGGGGRRRRRRRSSRLGEPVGAIPLLAALAPLAMQVLPGLIQGLTGGGKLSGYYGAPPPPPPPPYGYAGW